MIRRTPDHLDDASRHRRRPRTVIAEAPSAKSGVVAPATLVPDFVPNSTNLIRLESI